MANTAVLRHTSGTLASGANIRAMANKIALESPKLKDLTPEQLEQVAKVVISQRLTKELDKAAEFAAIDFGAETAVFLHTFKSRHSQRTYRNALDKLFSFCRSCNIEAAGLTPMQADNFIYELANKNSTSVTRLTASVASAFYTFLERRHEGIRNPFRGTKARPKERKERAFAIPSPKELEAIIKKVPKPYNVYISLMAQTGLRVGALPTLKKIGARWQAESKGKHISLSIPASLESDLAKQLDNLHSITAAAIQRMVEYYLKKLHSQGVIRCKYSPHDFRHYFAITEYARTKDIYQTKNLLNHSSIAVTERYLKGLGQL